jgi:hypothetical protein
MELSRAQAIIELQELDTECRELKRMLFELSCDIQRDVTTVDFEHLGSVMLRLRKAEAEKSTLLEMLIAAFNFQESAQAGCESEVSKPL